MKENRLFFSELRFAAEHGEGGYFNVWYVNVVRFRKSLPQLPKLVQTSLLSPWAYLSRKKVLIFDRFEAK